MNALRMSRASSYARQGVSGAANKFIDISDGFADRWRDAERGFRRLRIAAEERVDDTRRRIKAHPLATVALVAAGAFFLGSIAGRGNRHGRWR